MAGAQVSQAQISPLYSFSGTEGTGPQAGLIQAKDGNLYGTCGGGGANGTGTVFKITPGGMLTTLHSFSSLGPPNYTNADGAYPFAGLIQAKDGNFYGTTFEGGLGEGTVFRITTNGVFTLLYAFGGPDGALPEAGLIQARDGNLYGTTWEGGVDKGNGQAGDGTVFRITTGGTLTTLYTFSYGNRKGDGFLPNGLIQARDGNLYGTAYDEGANGYGTVFRITTNGVFTLLYAFGGPDGAFPKGLIQTKDGNLYGTTQRGGANDDGTVFRITTGGTLTTLYTFSALSNGTSGTGTNSDGAHPYESLIQAKDGNLYGTTRSGGAYPGPNGYGGGTVFRITTGGTLTTLYSFTGSTDGAYPQAGLIQARDGNLYGTTWTGGVDKGNGTVFRLHWQPLVHQPSFQAKPIQVSTMLLLTDGTVMCQEYLTSNWWRLTPDAFGGYVNGTWSPLAPSVVPKKNWQYGPLFYASAVLANGRVVVIGGEFNLGTTQVMTNLGGIYNPAINTWQVLSQPNFAGLNGNHIGDAQCCVLPNGQFLLAHPYDTQMALLDPVKLTWSVFTPTNKADIFDEEGWTLLPGGSILTADVWTSPNTERYNSGTHAWAAAGFVPQSLAYSGEIGPAVLCPDGTVFATGATGYNAVYDTVSEQWNAAPSFPTVTINGTSQQLCMADAPACLLPSGNVLCAASPYLGNNQWIYTTAFFEFDGANLNQTDSTPNAPVEGSYDGRMLLLPTGQVLYSHGNGSGLPPDVEVYTPDGEPDPAWAPTITACPATLTRGTTNVLQGTQLNGLSQGAMYGDDAQMATNYPLVRVTYNATGHVTYFRTHGHSSMGVATGNAVVSTNFDVPKNAETGAAQLEVVANGIASSPYSVNIK